MLLGRKKTIDHFASPASPKAIWSKVLPSLETACTMACWPSVLMQAPLGGGRLLPNDEAILLGDIDGVYLQGDCVSPKS